MKPRCVSPSQTSLPGYYEHHYNQYTAHHPAPRRNSAMVDKNHDHTDTVFHGDRTYHLAAVLYRAEPRSQSFQEECRNPVERIFREIKRGSPVYQ